MRMYLVFVALQVTAVGYPCFAQTATSVNKSINTKHSAIQKAKAVWVPLYGNFIYKEKPFRATLKNDSIWIVTGTVHTKKGGAAYIEIQKKDGKILKITHYK